MKFAYFDGTGRVIEAHDDDTIKTLPEGAFKLTDAQFLNRFDYELVANKLLLNPIVPPALSRSEQIAKAVNAVKFALQSAIDAKAREAGFSNGNAYMLYAGFTNAFKAPATVYAQWEASVWQQAEAYKALVLAGKAPMLTPDEAVAMMPVYPI